MKEYPPESWSVHEKETGYSELTEDGEIKKEETTGLTVSVAIVSLKIKKATKKDNKTKDNFMIISLYNS